MDLRIMNSIVHYSYLPTYLLTCCLPSSPTYSRIQSLIDLVLSLIIDILDDQTSLPLLSHHHVHCPACTSAMSSMNPNGTIVVWPQVSFFSCFYQLTYCINTSFRMRITIDDVVQHKTHDMHPWLPYPTPHRMWGCWLGVGGQRKTPGDPGSGIPTRYVPYTPHNMLCPTYPCWNRIPRCNSAEKRPTMTPALLHGWMDGNNGPMMGMNNPAPASSPMSHCS